VDNVNSFENASLFRDAARGKLYQFIHDIEGTDQYVEAIRSAMNRDLTLNMILLTEKDAQKQVEKLITVERSTLKSRLRRLPEDVRELVASLIRIGISEYIITNEDRKFFAQQAGLEDELEQETDLPTPIPDDTENPDDIPEGGFTDRDYFDEDVQLNDDYQPIEPDRGDYGDVRDRPENDYDGYQRYDDDIY
jgi:DNA-binding protein Fis